MQWSNNNNNYISHKIIISYQSLIIPLPKPCESEFCATYDDLILALDDPLDDLDKILHDFIDQSWYILESSWMIGSCMTLHESCQETRNFDLSRHVNYGGWKSLWVIVFLMKIILQSGNAVN